MIYSISSKEVVSLCEKARSGFEFWSRNLIHSELKTDYGNDYLNAKWKENENLFNTHTRRKIGNMLLKEPDRFKRQVDAFFLEDIINILCKEYTFKKYFKEPLEYIYPQGAKECRYYLEKIIKPRNKISHSNTISLREAEQLICYTNDFIDGLKNYYKSKGVERMWNVPQIIKVSDSLGNDYYFENNEKLLGEHIIIDRKFHVGERLRIIVYIDPSFNRDEYTVKWTHIARGEVISSNSDEITVEFNENHISIQTFIRCEVISNKDWHKCGHYDHCVDFNLCVLP